MIGYWIAFICIALVILVGFPFGYSFMEKSGEQKVVPTEEQKRTGIITLVKSMALYLLGDLFFMAHFLDVLLLKFIFGGLMLLLIYENLGVAVSSPVKKNGFARFSMIQDFVIGIGLSIYLIFIIPDSDLRNVVIPIVAAIYGGLITLAGVSWTIRWTEKNRENEEVEKIKPLVFLASDNTSPDRKASVFVIRHDDNRGNIETCEKCKGSMVEINNFFLSNSDNSYCCFRGILINGELFQWFNEGKMLDKKEKILVSFETFYQFEGEVKEVAIILEDMRKNVYVMKTDSAVEQLDDLKRIKTVSLIGGYLPEISDFDFDSKLKIRTEE